VRRGWRVFFGMICVLKNFIHSLRRCRLMKRNGRYGYQIQGKGRWMSMVLKKPKQKQKGAGGTKKDRRMVVRERGLGGRRRRRCRECE